MLTLRDCIDLSGVDPEEIDAVAEHEKLPFIIAMEKGSWMLEHSWGPSAMRQIIQDDLAKAARQGAWQHVDELTLTYHHTCHRLPEGRERRHIGRR